MNKSLTEEFNLSEKDCSLLDRLEDTLPFYADLLGADLFLGCFRPGENVSVVVGEACPLYARSNYLHSVMGQEATPDKEPALFSARAMKSPAYDILAVTQEDKHVRQDVLPLMNEAGDVFGTLICERDVSQSLRKERKYDEIVRRFNTGEQENMALAHLTEKKEIHHRVKNNLQMIASILNMQARRVEDPGVQKILRENVSRILSMAETYDLLVTGDNTESVSLMEMCRRLGRNCLACASFGDAISIDVSGDDIKLPADTSTIVAIVVNELLTNAIEHAFPGRDSGKIKISLQRGISRFNVLIEDDGIGFDVEHCGKDSFGLAYVKATVEERLQGTLRIFSGEGGSRVVFDFSAEE